MSIVAVKKYKSKIEIACDSQITYGQTKIVDERMKSNSKIIKCNGLIMGVVGMVRDNAYMNMFIKTHKPKDATVDSVSEFIFEFNEWAKKKDTAFELESMYILIYKNKIFTVDSSLLVLEVPMFTAIGSGYTYALAALHLGKSVTQAVDVAKELDIYCSGETILIKKSIK